MDLRSDFIEPVTPGLSYVWNAEDSGYHTSFTPSSFEQSEVVKRNLPTTKVNIRKARCYFADVSNVAQEINFNAVRKCSLVLHTSSDNESPQQRKGLKRSYPEDIENADVSFGSSSTPTSLISGVVRRLKLNDSFKYHTSTESIVKSDSCLTDSLNTSIPTTPIKKACRNHCISSNPETLRRSGKNLSFIMHSLSCDRNVLQPKKIEETKQTSKFVYNIKPHQRFDMIKMLYQKANVFPAVLKILSYLSHEDIFNFTLVSNEWCKIWEDVSDSRIQSEYSKYLNNVTGGKENRSSTPKPKQSRQCRPFMEIKNLNTLQPAVPVSPTKSPRTNRFIKFTKTTQLDARKQLPCIKCQQPSKITKEENGEEWAMCTSQFCAFRFCPNCKYEKHSGKSCVQFDLDGPSPSKRTCKKNIGEAGTKKSRKNLRRLLMI